MTYRQLAAAAGLIVALAAAGEAFGILSFRFWAWAWEAQEIGRIAYGGAITDKMDLLIRVEQQLRECEARPGVDCTFIRQQIERLKREIEDLKAKRGKYSG